MPDRVPGWEGSTGPFPSEYGKPHVYARDVHSGAGNCMCGAGLGDKRHVQAAPGVPVPGRKRWPQPPVTSYTPDPLLPPAILVDLDGTLALHNGRGPFEYEHCGEDLLCEPVAYTLSLHSANGDRIILMSGRPDDHREATEAWLAKHGVAYNELWMRAAGDYRRDDIVKYELFDKHVRHEFNVRFVLDDRDRVIDLWRRIGLSCWQVAYGDF